MVAARDKEEARRLVLLYNLRGNNRRSRVPTRKGDIAALRAEVEQMPPHYYEDEILAEVLDGAPFQSHRKQVARLWKRDLGMKIASPKTRADTDRLHAHIVAFRNLRLAGEFGRLGAIEPEPDEREADREFRRLGRIEQEPVQRLNREERLERFGGYWAWMLPLDADTHYRAVIQTLAEHRRGRPVVRDEEPRAGVKTYTSDVRTKQDAIDAVMRTFRAQQRSFKLNAMILFVYESVVEGVGVYTVHIDDYKMAPLFNRPELVRNEADLNNLLLNKFSDENVQRAFERPNTHTRCLGIHQITLEVSPVEAPIGANTPMPEWIKSSKSVVNPIVENNLCVFGCIALHRQRRRRPEHITAQATALCEACGYTAEEYEGADVKTFPHIEKTLNTSFMVYTATRENEQTRLNLYYRSTNESEEKIDLLLHDGHMMLLTKRDVFARCYVCDCGATFNSSRELVQHRGHCGGQQEVFPDDAPISAEPGIVWDLLSPSDERSRYYPYFACYDFETRFINNRERRGESTYLVATHVPMSYSIASNVPGKEGPYHEQSSDPKALARLFVRDVKNIANRAETLMRERFADLLEGDSLTIDEKRRFLNWIRRLPFLGFNSAAYDLPLVRGVLFTELGVCEPKADPTVIKSGNSYASVGVKNVSFLDVSKYLAAGTSLDKYLKAYLGRSVKGTFPYEYITSFEKLWETKLPPREAFSSRLKNTVMSEEDYAEAQDVWRREGCLTLSDYLRWYNNLDVVPMVQAVEIQRNAYRAYGLDMLKDAISIPGLAYKILIRSGLDLTGDQQLGWNRVPPAVDDKAPSRGEFARRMAQYRIVDVAAERGEPVFTYEQFAAMWGKACFWCHQRMDPWGLDRIDNSKPHSHDNVVLACPRCNNARGTKRFSLYLRRLALQEIEREKPRVHTIAEEAIFHDLRNGVVGGPSIVFHRYHEAYGTRIKRPRYNAEADAFEEGVEGKLVKRIVGFDANALYLWCQGGTIGAGGLMPTGTLRYNETVSVENVHEHFGFAIVDIETPAHLKDHFSEMQPVFKNASIDGERKLIGSYFGKEIVLYSPLLRWYTDHGLVITKVHRFIEATPGYPFRAFADAVSKDRRQGDMDPSTEIIAETSKLIGNSSFGRTGMDRTKHTNTLFAEAESLPWHAQKRLFMGASNIDERTVEITKTRKNVHEDMPLQIASAIYQLAKLRMLEFYYDFMCRFVEREDFQYIEMDTDSAYMAITSERFEDLIKPEMREVYEREKRLWFPRDDTKEHAAYDRREPGLFKIEFEGKAIVALASKLYFVLGDTKSKFSSKGVQKAKNKDILNLETYKSVLMTGEVAHATNSGFRSIGGTVRTYEVRKSGLTAKYDKKVVADDRVSCLPTTL